MMYIDPLPYAVRTVPTDSLLCCFGVSATSNLYAVTFFVIYVWDYVGECFRNFQFNAAWEVGISVFRWFWPGANVPLFE